MPSWKFDARKLSVFQDSFPLAQSFRISRGKPRSIAQTLRVSLSKDDITGQGECLPYARYDETLQSVEAQIKTLPEEFTQTTLQSLLPPGAARNAVDCAIWDWRAKKAGQRVWEIAGIAAPEKIISAYTISLDTPENMEEMARKNSARPLLKIKLGTPDDMPRLEAVRRGSPNATIIVDANEGWSHDIYRDLAPHLLRLGVGMVEQPLPADQDDLLAEIERPVPVCADESCHDRASLAGLKNKYDMINIKLDKTGGLTEALALKHAAFAQGFDVMIGCMVGSSLGIAPATLLCQDACFVDLDAPLLLAKDRKNALVFFGSELQKPDVNLWG